MRDLKYIHKSDKSGYSVSIPRKAARRLGRSRRVGYRATLAEALELRNSFFTRHGIPLPFESVGVIGDTHFPFVHPRYLEFIKDTFNRYGVTRIVHIGDLIDNHAVSRHKTEPVADGVMTEFHKAKEMVEEWSQVFPTLTLTQGNHDSILERQAAELGLPSFFIKNPKELYGMPEGWEVVESTIIDDVLYKHGTGSGGMHGAYNSAKRQCMSVVQGHTHSYAGVKYISTPQKIWFGMSVGCGIDISAYAFLYGKYLENRPILGCGIVRSSKEAFFVPMDLDRYRKGE